MGETVPGLCEGAAQKGQQDPCYGCGQGQNEHREEEGRPDQEGRQQPSEEEVRMSGPAHKRPSIAMSALAQLATSLGRADEQPNVALAEAIAAEKNSAAIRELVD